MTSKGKFYKCTLVPLFSIIICLCLVVKTVEANTTYTVNTRFNVQSDGTLYGQYSAQAIQNIRPTSIVPYGTDSDGNLDEVQNHYNYDFTLNPRIKFYGTTYTNGNENYYSGYINGIVDFSCDYSFTLNSGTMTSSVPQINLGNIDNDNEEHIKVGMAGFTKSGSNVTIRYMLIFSNYYINTENSSGTEFVDTPVSININIEYNGKATGDHSITFTPTQTCNWSTAKCTLMANAGSSIAGEVYSAIENSTSVSDIVHYLSLIEDSNGDLNVAVSNINENLIPSIITYLVGLLNNMNYANNNLGTIINYLNVISSTWPNYSSMVLFYLDQLTNMNSEQSSLAAEVESQYEAKASEGAVLNEGMQVVIPSVNQNSFDINSGIDTGAITTLSAFWSMFTHNSLISIMFGIAIAGIAAGFFLYGKKD